MSIALIILDCTTSRSRKCQGGSAALCRNVHLRSREEPALSNAECICEELVSSGRRGKANSAWLVGQMARPLWAWRSRRHHRRLWLACHLLVVRRTQHGQHSVCLVFHHRSPPTNRRVNKAELERVTGNETPVPEPKIGSTETAWRNFILLIKNTAIDGDVFFFCLSSTSFSLVLFSCSTD